MPFSAAAHAQGRKRILRSTRAVPGGRSLEALNGSDRHMDFDDQLMTTLGTFATRLRRIRQTWEGAHASHYAPDSSHAEERPHEGDDV